MPSRLKYVLAFGFVGFLWLVGVCTYLPIPAILSPLRGAATPPPAPRWDPASLRSGATFRAIETWYSAHVGLRTFWVRLDNQVSYSLFGETQKRAEGTHVVAGDDDWLFEHHYITYAIKPAFLGEAEIRATLERIRRVQDKLAARGVPFLLVVAPSKVEVYPEKVPAVYWGGRDPAAVETNFERARPLLAEYGINYYDGPARFRAWKQTMPDNLFIRSGTHWSYYAATHVLADLRERLNPVMRRPLPEFRIEALRSGDPRGNDEDLIALMNLLVEAPYRHPAPYPQLARQTDVPTEALPRLLWIHDSFGWPLIDLVYPANAAQPSESLYYFQTAFAIPGVQRLDRNLQATDWENYLKDFDAVVMVWTEIAFDFTGWGFFEAVDRALP